MSKKWERREKKQKNKSKMRMSGKGNKRVILDLYWRKKYEENENA